MNQSSRSLFWWVVSGIMARLVCGLVLVCLLACIDRHSVALYCAGVCTYHYVVQHCIEERMYEYMRHEQQPDKQPHCCSPC